MTIEITTAEAKSEGREFFVKRPIEPKPLKQSAAPPKATVKIYHNGVVSKFDLRTSEDVHAHKDAEGLRWFNIDGSHHQRDLVHELGVVFGFHELAMEDVRNRNQRAKFDKFDDGSSEPHLFVVARIPDAGDPGETEQISIFFRENLVVTIQESPGGDCLIQARRNAVRAAKAGTLSAGLLAAEIIDASVMDYIAHLDGPEEEIERLRKGIGTGTTDELVRKFHRFRNEALHLLRDIRPLEDVLYHLAFTEERFVGPAARSKFKDALDHQRRAVDTLNHLAEESKELMNLALAMASHKMNEVMQVLTVVSAIFIPISFFAGVWGMNFQHMPELSLRFAYGGAILVFLSITAIQLYLFWRNDWLVLPRLLAEREPHFMKQHKAAHRKARSELAKKTSA